MVAALRTAWSIAWVIYRAAREYERVGVERLSRESAIRDRRRIERAAMQIHDQQDTGWRKWTKVDNKLPMYLAELLKSDNLTMALMGSEDQQAAARGRIEMDADAVLKWDGPAADRGKP